MGTAERRLAIYRYLCRRRYATMTELATEFGASIRTIQRDLYEVEFSLHLPLVTKAGRHGGGIYVLDGYSPGQEQHTAEEAELLKKIHRLVSGALSSRERELLERMIANNEHTLSKKRKNFFNPDSSCRGYLVG